MSNHDDELKNVGYSFPVLKPYDFLSPRNPHPLGPYSGGPSQPSNNQTYWKNLYTPFHAKEHHEDVKNVGSYSFPVHKPYDFLSPRSANPLGPYKGGPPPEPTWWQKVWPIVGKESLSQWYKEA